MNGQEPARRVPVKTALHGLRLDRAVMTLCGLSLRAARRRIEDGGILLDGRPAAAALRLRAGQTLELLPDDHICRGHAGDEPALAVRLLGRQGDYAAFVKPAGLHSSPLAGRCAPNLEDAARTLWGDEAPPCISSSGWIRPPPASSARPFPLTPRSASARTRAAAATPRPIWPCCTAS